VNWFFAALAARARVGGGGTELRLWLGETAAAGWLRDRAVARTGGRPWRCRRRSPAASPLDGAPVQADPEPGGYLDGQFGA
jgi:hypothetical protein